MVLLSTPDRVPRTGSEIGDWPTCAADQSPEDVPGPEETYFFFLDPPFFAAFFFPPFFFAIARSPPWTLAPGSSPDYLAGTSSSWPPDNGGPARTRSPEGSRGPVTARSSRRARRLSEVLPCTSIDYRNVV